jgi:hypothetical protein
MSKLFKNLVKVSVAAATVGGLCYAFKEKIRESKVYKDYDVDTKLNKVKTTIKDKMPKVFDNEEDYVEDDEIFFEDEEFNPEKASRDYVSINLDSVSDEAENASEDKTSETEASETEASEDKTSEDKKDADSSESGDVPTIEL